MKIADLSLTQDGLRDYNLSKMIDFVKSGGIYTQDILDRYNQYLGSNLIIINRFEDGRLFLHDGHHRVSSIYLSGERDFLYDEEIQYIDYKYANFVKPNFKNGWYTPFDPRTHVRIPDFFKFKEHVMQMAAHDPNTAIEYIFDNQDSYLLPRTQKHDNITGILDIVDVAFSLSRNNLGLIGECVCYYCKALFEHSAINRWVEKEQTAVCPYCGIDAILSKKYVSSDEVLDSLHQRWFNENCISN